MTTTAPSSPVVDYPLVTHGVRVEQAGLFEVELALEHESPEPAIALLTIAARGGRRFQMTGTGEGSAWFEIDLVVLERLAHELSKAVRILREQHDGPGKLATVETLLGRATR